MAIQAIAFFCDDARQEVGGSETIVGVLRDNLYVPEELPGGFPKLTVYVRIHFDVDEEPQEILGEIRTPWGQVFRLGENSLQLSRDALAAAKKNDAPICGIILRMIFTPLPVQEHGRISVVMNIKGEERICGQLNLIADTNQSNASAPPASPPPTV